MAGGKEPDISDPVIFFKQANASTIARIIERAERNAARTARRQHSVVRKLMKPRKTLLGTALGLALAHHGRTAKKRASIRHTAPDTGGRPYHFGFTTVTKGQSARGGKPKAGGKGSAGRGGGGGSGSGGGGGGGGDGGGGGSGGGATATGTKAGTASRNKAGAPSTREGAHQTYAERAAALEKNAQPLDQDLTAAPAKDRDREQEHDTGPELGARSRQAGLEQDDITAEPVRRFGEQALVPGAEIDRNAWDKEAAQEKGNPREWVETEMGRGPGISERHTEAAAQAYIEDPAKVRTKLHGNTVSFGTIGETMEQRQEFWELVHKHESVDGRTQSRLVLELPHEADAKARHEIVRRYVKEFEDKGIPYWAAIHAPTAKNDDRNHHAHVVFIDRPAKRMPHPDTGEMVWDFTITQTYKTNCRHTLTTRPFRQNRDPEMRGRGYIKTARARFSDITNAVMEKHGVGIRYDPRSYKDMGLDVKPMEHVARILADKSKTQAFVVMDPDWTRKMIDAEMAAAALRRDETYQALRRTEDRLQEATRGLTSLNKANAKLPRRLRLSPGHMLSKKVAGTLTTKWMEIERNRLAARFVEESTVRTLNHVIEATTPQRNSRGAARTHASANAPDPEDMREINVAAREELAAYQDQRRRSRTRFMQQENSIFRQWDAAATPPAFGPVPHQASRTQAAPPVRADTVHRHDPQTEAPTVPAPAPAPVQRQPDPKTAGPVPTRAATQDPVRSRPMPGTRAPGPLMGRPPAAPHPFIADVMALMKHSIDGVIRDSDGPGDIKRTAEETIARLVATNAALKAMFGVASRKPPAQAPVEMQQSAEGRARTDAASGVVPPALTFMRPPGDVGSKPGAQFPELNQMRGVAARSVFKQAPAADPETLTRGATRSIVPTTSKDVSVGEFSRAEPTFAVNQRPGTFRQSISAEPLNEDSKLAIQDQRYQESFYRTVESLPNTTQSVASIGMHNETMNTNEVKPLESTLESTEDIKVEAEKVRKRRRRALLAKQARDRGSYDR